MDICTFDLEFSDSMNCKMSFLEFSSRLCNAAWDIWDMLEIKIRWLKILWTAVYGFFSQISKHSTDTSNKTYLEAEILK